MNKAKSKFTWLLDNGHGGVINGVYQTQGKRSPFLVYNMKVPLYEGEFNRAIVSRIIEKLTALGIKYVNITDSNDDYSIDFRVRKANDYQDALGNCILISIHANAGGGSGIEIFTSRGLTKSDGYAKIFSDHAKYKNLNMRVPSIKQAGFFILRKTSMPAILTENYFMDTSSDLSFINSKAGRDTIANYHVNAIKEIERNASRS